MEIKRKIIVISAVNLVEGGTLTILRDCLKFLSNHTEICDNYHIIALVNNKNVAYFPNIEYIEIPWAKKNWINRIWCEFITMKKISKKLFPVYCWLSLHDITPNVNADIRATYCHNPTPFYKPKIYELKYSLKVFLFSIFYKYLYKINIKKNAFVIVQQDWIREAFAKLYGLDKNIIVVSYPEKQISAINSTQIIEDQNSEVIFFYPSLSRPFKNFEIICKAVLLLTNKNIENFKVILTIDGTEDSYSKEVLNHYKHLNNILFAGRLPHKEVLELYVKASCLLFPSRLETWGLPISEFSVYDKPIIVADLPYAHETASSSKYVSFFDPMNAEELAKKMLCVINKDYTIFTGCLLKEVNQPFVQSWANLFKVILKSKESN